MSNPALDDAVEMADAVARAAADRTVEVRRAVEARTSAAREWAVDQGDVLRDTVQTKPFIAIGVSAASAFAAGLVVGIILARLSD